MVNHYNALSGPLCAELNEREKEGAQVLRRHPPVISRKNRLIPAAWWRRVGGSNHQSDAQANIWLVVFFNERNGWWVNVGGKIFASTQSRCLKGPVRPNYFKKRDPSERGWVDFITYWAEINNCTINRSSETGLSFVDLLHNNHLNITVIILLIFKKGPVCRI